MSGVEARMYDDESDQANETNNVDSGRIEGSSSCALIESIRLGDLKAVQEALLEEAVDINETCIVRGVRVEHYRSHPLFEACRTNDVSMVETILRRPDCDVNAPATSAKISSLADACNRGADRIVEVLLDDPRTDPFAGSKDVLLPLQFACMRGFLPIVALFIERKFVPFAHEMLLLSAARDAEQPAVERKLYEYFLSQRDPDGLPPRLQVERLWLAFHEADRDGSGALELAELRPLAARLGCPLTEPELSEAIRALDTDGDGTVDFDELVAFWLGGTEGLDPEVVEAVEQVRTTARETGGMTRKRPRSGADVLAATGATSGAVGQGVVGKEGENVSGAEWAPGQGGSPDPAVVVETGVGPMAATSGQGFRSTLAGARAPDTNYG